MMKRRYLIAGNPFGAKYLRTLKLTPSSHLLIVIVFVSSTCGKSQGFSSQLFISLPLPEPTLTASS
jgi:hypothetical protein